MTRQQKIVSKVPEFKAFTREQLKVEVKKAREAFTHEKKKLDSLEKELKKHIEEFSYRQGHGSIGVREMDLFYTYFEHLGRHIEQQKKCILVCLAELEEKQKVMHEAYKEQRLMEIFHDKILHKDMRETIQDEQKETDYLLLTRRAGR